MQLIAGGGGRAVLGDHLGNSIGWAGKGRCIGTSVGCVRKGSRRVVKVGKVGKVLQVNSSGVCTGKG